MEDKIVYITQSGQQTENQMKKTWTLTRDLWDNIKQANLGIIKIPEGEGKGRWIENIFEELMSESFLNLKKIDWLQTGPHKDIL